MKFSQSVLALCALAVLCLPAFAGKTPDSLLNGSFSSPLTNGWQQEARDFVGYHNIALLKDGGVRVVKEMCGRARLFQEVNLPDLNRTFSARVQFKAQSTTPGYFSYGALMLQFVDSTGNTLAETRFYSAAGMLPWKNTSRLRLVPVAKSGTWTDISLNLADELKTNLKDVHRTEVKGLRVVIEAFGSGRSGC